MPTLNHKTPVYEQRIILLNSEAHDHEYNNKIMHKTRCIFAIIMYLFKDTVTQKKWYSISKYQPTPQPTSTISGE